MTRSRLDRKATAETAVAKGSAGDGAFKALLEGLGWAQVADLGRTYPGADLVAICGCELKHLLWAEVKSYPRGSIEPESWTHMIARAMEVTRRPREQFVLATYQAVRGGDNRPGARKREWWVSEWVEKAVSTAFSVEYPGFDQARRFKRVKHRFSPPCGGGYPMGLNSNPPAPYFRSASDTTGIAPADGNVTFHPDGSPLFPSPRADSRAASRSAQAVGVTGSGTEAARPAIEEERE